MRMTGIYLTLILTFVGAVNLYAQESDTTKNNEFDKSEKSTSNGETLEFIFRPTLGLGVGMFTFIGDVANNHEGGHPTVSRIGYDLRLSNPLNDYFDLNFYVIYGKLSANERSLTNVERNLNFQSEIRTGGMTVSYNFQNFRKNKERILEPYLSAGFESFEFLSKTDLFDEFGNKYHYWTDGSIRNLAETDPNSASSILLNRDYIYESDLREQNVDGFGKYRERSWAFPVGVGALIHLNQRWKFRIGTSVHFTITDLVDNVSSESIGDRAGDSKNDKFLYTHFSVNYDLQRLKEKEIPDLDPKTDDLFDILAKDTVDTDDDGVVDFIDFCQYTGKGLPVDVRGCPFDKDADRVFDFQDDELTSAAGVYVNEKGVTVTDEMIYERYLRYTDTTGNYTGKIENTVESRTDLGYSNKTDVTENNPMNYVVVLGTQEKSISANDLHKYLGYKDFKMITKGDTVYYIVGSYDNVSDAVKRKYDLEKDGVKTTGIASTQGNKNGNPDIKTIPDKNLPLVDGGINNQNNEVVFRVQIGAFSKKLSANIFKNVPDLIVIPGDDGITRYYSGAFSDIFKASERKINMLDIGFEGSFVVAYQGGARKPLSEVGVEMIQKEDTNESNDVKNTSIDKSKIKYKVQVGAFKNDVPTQMLDKYLTIGGVTPIRDGEITKYLSGNFTTKEDASNAMQSIIKAGITDAFIVSDYNGKILTMDELKSLMNE
jgi:hypothetical protein